jgi:hypothetical protein
MLLIFCFCVINDVQNPHVLVLKIIFCCVSLAFKILGLGIKHWLKNQRD